MGYVCNLGGGKCRQRNVVYRRSHCGLRVCGRNESFGIVVCRVLSVFESDRLHWLQDGRFDDGTEYNIFSILDDFVLLSRPSGLDLESPVDKKEAFPPFFVYFESARPDFGESGRQKRDISPVFCLLLVSHALNFDQPVDKNQTFPPFFVYFRFRTLWI